VESVSDPSVIGITGLGTVIGRRLGERLLGRSPALRVVGFDLRRPAWLGEDVDFCPLDLTDPTAGSRLADAFRRYGIEILVHAAFRTDPTPDLDRDHELETIGSLHVMNACAAAEVKRLVVASSTMLYGPRQDNPNFLTEEHPLRGHPDAHSVNNRVEAEALLADWAVRHPTTEVTVLRTCWVLGRHGSDRVTRYLSLPVVPKLLGYDPLMQFIHEEDCIRAFEEATLESHPGVWNVVGRGVLPLSNLLRLAGKRILALPAPLLYRMAYYPSQSRSGDPPNGFYAYLRHLWVADGSRGWREFGEPMYTTKEAWIDFVSARRMLRYR
jgi:UDP-glucose 4-epimerase